MGTGTRPCRASWAMFVAVRLHRCTSLHSCRRPRCPCWYGTSAQITHPALIHYFCAEEQITAALLIAQIVVTNLVSKSKADMIIAMVVARIVAMIVALIIAMIINYTFR